MAGFTESDLFACQLRYWVGEGTRVENAISSGLFDTYWTIGGRGHWIENKIIQGRTILVRATQFTWARAHLGHGARNLWFCAMKDDASMPVLFAARDVLLLCDLERRQNGKLVVPIDGLACQAKGWSPIFHFLLQKA